MTSLKPRINAPALQCRESCVRPLSSHPRRTLRLAVQSSSQPASTASAPAASSKQKPLVRVCFQPGGQEVEARAGEVLADVAARAGVDVELGCNQGNCGVCEMELQKFSYSEQEARLVGSGPQVVRTCVARVPGGGFPLVELQPLADDLAWGVDGFDT